MKFNQYLTESSGLMSVEKILLTLYKHCKPYLKDTLKKKVSVFDDFMYSGRDSHKDIFTKSIRKDRRPKDSDYRVHKILDDALYKRFGWRSRSEAIFTSGSLKEARNYGSNVYMIFPVDKYKFVYSISYRDIVDVLEEDIWEVTYERMRDATYIDEEIARIEYDDEYGEGGEGSWFFEGIDTDESDSYDAVEYVISNWDDFRFDSENDAKEDRNNIENSLNWLPSVTWFDWFESHKDEFYNNSDFEDEVERKTKEIIEDEVDNYVDTCRDTNIMEAIGSQHEIMLGSKRYIAIHTRYKEVLSLIFKEGYMEPTELRLRAWYNKQGKRFPKQLEMWENR